MTVRAELTTEQILAALRNLPENEREALTYQLRKEEALNNLMKLAEEIQADVPPGEEISMEEIQEVVDEVRQERYNRLKKKKQQAE